MDCRKRIEAYLDGLEDEQLIFLTQIYKDAFSDISEGAFFKMMERMAASGKVSRVSKGIYMKSGLTQGQMENAILNYYFGADNDSGMYIGEQLFAKYNLGKAYDLKKKEMYSTKTNQDTKVIGNVIIYRSNVELSYDNAKMIEMFEIIEHHDKIKQLSKKSMTHFLDQAAKLYDDNAACNVIEAMHYKKRTIAALKLALEKRNIENSLGKYLNTVSRYVIPDFI